MPRQTIPGVTRAQPGGPHRGWPVLRLGFRPFYLGAAAFAVVGIAAWYPVYMGRLPVAPGLSPLLWHAHEMVFGFVAAVVVGFLLTAGRVWTRLATPRGPLLGALFVLWALGRVAAFTGPPAVFLLLDGSFLPIVAGLFIALLLRSRNARNAGVGAVLAALALANLAFHLALMGCLPIDPMRALFAAIALIVVLESIIASRVVPNFTMNAVPGLKLALSPRRDLLTTATTGAGLLLWACGLAAHASIAVLALAALLQAWRLVSWKPWRTLGQPMLWVLHLACAWIPVGLGLLAASQAGWIAQSPALHALTVGSMGGLIIGMITRTARAHTGRPLRAAPDEVLAYLLLFAAALVRVFVVQTLPGWSLQALVASGALWLAGFTLYLARYLPWLLRARLDGQDG